MRTSLNALALLFSLAPTIWAGDPIRTASSPQPLGISGGGPSFEPAFSADGKKVVFVSAANNLVTNDNLGLNLDVFVRDLIQPRTTLVSVDWKGIGGADRNAGAPSISSNGQWVAFASAAGNLVSGQAQGPGDIFVRDLAAGTTILASVPESGAGPAMGDPLSQNALLSDHPLISADGSLIVFESGATNLVTGTDTNRETDLFLRDLQWQTNTLISVGTGQAGAANRGSSLSSITPDGQKILFLSAATDLVPDAPLSRVHVYLRDLSGPVTVCVSAPAFREHPDLVRALQPVVSENGGVVAFKAVSSLNSVLWFHHDLTLGQSVLVSSNYLGGSVSEVHRNVDKVENAAPSLSRDGRFMAYEAENRIWIWDAVAQSNLPLLPGLTPVGEQRAKTPVLSGDGQRVVFVSDMEGLTANDNQGVYQIYVRDRGLELTRLVSAGWNGAVPTSDLEHTLPVLSPDGGRVAFATRDASLVAEDRNATTDVFLADLGAETNSLLSSRDAGLPPSTGTAMTRLDPTSVSFNGRFVAFSSWDSSYSLGDTNRWPDVFVHDFQNGLTVPVTLLSNVNRALGLGEPPATSPAEFQTNGPVGQASISADGRFVVYQHRIAGNVDSAYYELFLWSRSANDLRLITRTVGGLPPSWETSFRFNSERPSISHNGGRIAFQSDVSAGDFDGVSSDSIYTLDVFFYYADGTDQGIVLVSTPNGLASGNGPSSRPWIGPDGTWVAYVSLATDLTSQPAMGAVPRVHAWHEPTRRNRLVSYDSNLVGLAEPSSNVVFSANGRYLVFDTLTTRTVYRHDLLTTTTNLEVVPMVINDTEVLVTNEMVVPGYDPNLVVCTNCQRPSVSRDGRYVAFERPPDADPEGMGNVFVKDTALDQELLVSRSVSGSGGGNGRSHTALMAGNGRWVVFLSEATDLTSTADLNHATDVFLRDLALDQTMMISRNVLGLGSGNNRSWNPILSGDGRVVVFQSFASDLTSGDYNATADIFALRISLGDEDGDNLDDDWEMAYFGDLNRDGTGDEDMDGHSDQEEFLAGTDPTDEGSILRVLTLTAALSGKVTLLWSAVPGQSYQVEVKDALTGSGWLPLTGAVLAEGPMASAVDPKGTLHGQQFYRVRVLK